MEGCLVLILVQTAWRISKIHEEVLVALKIAPNCDVATYVSSFKLMHSLQELLASKAWKKFVTSLIWCSIGAHPSPCPISSIPTDQVLLLHICFKAMIHPTSFTLEIFLLYFLHVVVVVSLSSIFVSLFQSFEEVVGMIWNLLSFLNTNYRQIPWWPNLKFKSYQSSNFWNWNIWSIWLLLFNTFGVKYISA